MDVSLGGLARQLVAAQVENERLRLELIAAQPLYSRRQLEAENERLRAALWPFAMSYQIGAGYCRDDFRRASEAMGELPIAIEQLEAKK